MNKPKGTIYEFLPTGAQDGRDAHCPDGGLHGRPRRGCETLARLGGASQHARRQVWPSTLGFSALFSVSKIFTAALDLFSQSLVKLLSEWREIARIRHAATFN